MAAFPSPATLVYFDQANRVPAPQGVNSPFNNESQDIWMGYDQATGQLCFTNFSRTTVIGCIGGTANYSYFAAEINPLN